VCSAYYPNKRRGFRFQTPMLHGWENFFIVGATAGATLIGLLFVAITLGAGLSTPQGLDATRAFLTPTLIRFGGVLFECMAVLPPWPSAWPVGFVPKSDRQWPPIAGNYNFDNSDGKLTFGTGELLIFAGRKNGVARDAVGPRDRGHISESGERC
jgi:hypothetical protein